MAKKNMLEIDEALNSNLKPTVAVKHCAPNLFDYIVKHAALDLDVVVDQDFLTDFIFEQKLKGRNYLLVTVKKALAYLTYEGQLVHIGGLLVYQINHAYYPKLAMINSFEKAVSRFAHTKKFLPSKKYKWVI